MRLAEGLTRLVNALDACGVAHAVVGGLAASARGEVRFTRDIDVAVAVEDDAQAEQLIYQLTQQGYGVVATVEQDRTARLATARLRSAGGVICDLIFATSGIESEIVARAEPMELFPNTNVRTATAEELLATKVLAAAPARPQDLADIQAIVKANDGLDEAAIVELLLLIEVRGYSRGQNLLEKWEHLKSELELRIP